MPRAIGPDGRCVPILSHFPQAPSSSELPTSSASPELPKAAESKVIFDLSEDNTSRLLVQ